ncbi:MAG: lysophospholipid acyltransferase family protein [bacterium]|nr:lysophospholipid acyltransferase family protein [bacterium]MDE0668701.1 lysophospholipid acyltransferase family protein [bacterium]
MATADRWPSVRIYWLCRNLGLLAGLLYFRVRVRGKEHLRTPGPAILAPVHRSNLDVPLIAGHCPRRLRSLAKQAMFRGPVSRRFSAAIGAFPVQRDHLDRVALETAQALLGRGEMLLVFPEGTRGSGSAVGEVQNGCAYLATVTGAPVIPVGVAGTEQAMPPGAKFPRPRRVVLNVGEPIEPSEATSAAGDGRERRRLLSQRVQAEMQRLLEEAHDALAARAPRGAHRAG